MRALSATTTGSKLRASGAGRGHAQGSQSPAPAGTGAERPGEPARHFRAGAAGPGKPDEVRGCNPREPARPKPSRGAARPQSRARYERWRRVRLPRRSAAESEGASPSPRRAESYNDDARRRVGGLTRRHGGGAEHVVREGCLGRPSGQGGEAPRCPRKRGRSPCRKACSRALTAAARRVASLQAMCNYGFRLDFAHRGAKDDVRSHDYPR